MITPESPSPIPVTGWAVASIEPHEWLRVSDYLSGLLKRAPLTSKGWEGERIVLGALASELKGMALEAGEPIDDPQEAAAYEAHLDQAIADHQRQMRADREAAASAPR